MAIEFKRIDWFLLVVQTESDPQLTGSYNECVSALAIFRSYHIQVVAK